MGGRGSGSGISSNASSGGANSTPTERSIARNLNSGNWEPTINQLNKAQVGSEISVGESTFTKVSNNRWRGLNTGGFPILMDADDVAQEVAARTYSGAKAKVKLRR